MNNNSDSRLMRLFTETLGLNRGVALTLLVLTSVVLVAAGFWFFHSAPPSTITITSGPSGSIFDTNAQKYAAILARNGVKLKVVPSHGSLENLDRLLDPAAHVDIGFIQDGVTNGLTLTNLMSLGSLYYQPLLVFYRGAKVELLSEFAGKRLAIGSEGSGTRALALTLLAANGIEPGGPTKLLDNESADATKELEAGTIDAVFLMGDSASPETMRKLLRAADIQLLSFTQADAYTRKISYLNKLDLPKGGIDFGKNIPDHDVYLIGPTVELVARRNLHPALSDLLLEAATEVHGTANLLRRRGEFPAPLERDFRLSTDALRYYKSGKSFLYRTLPFWLATLVNQILVAVVPLIVVLIPTMRAIPKIYKWRLRLRILRWYRALLALESQAARCQATDRPDLLRRLDDIEQAVNRMKMPASFAESFYVLRGHIDFVRAGLLGKEPPPR